MKTSRKGNETSKGVGKQRPHQKKKKIRKEKKREKD